MIFHGEDDGKHCRRLNCSFSCSFSCFIPPCVYLGVFRLIFPPLHVFASSFSLAASHTYTLRIVGAGDIVPWPYLGLGEPLSGRVGLLASCESLYTRVCRLHTWNTQYAQCGAAGDRVPRPYLGLGEPLSGREASQQGI